MSIRAENVRYVYSQGLPGETVALDNVSFEIAAGELVGVIGHTGSGKSTLLQQLNGLLKPTSGSIFVDGLCITDGTTKLTDIRKKVGIVFQYPEYQLFEETVAKDVAFGAKNSGLEGDELDKAVSESLRMVGLDYEVIKDKSPFELSGGQKRRVAIAGVIAMRPSTLILDEPTAGLDPVAHKEILNMVRSIHRNEQITVIFVSHNMADIAELADRVIALDKGNILIEGTPEYVFSHSEKLIDAGLGIPPVMRFMKKVNERIPEIKSDVLTPDAAEREFAEYIKKRRCKDNC